MDRNLKCDHLLESCKAVLYSGAGVCFVNLTQFVILKKLSVSDLALSGVKGLTVKR